MENFFWDSHGITWEGATLLAVLSVGIIYSLLYLAGKGIMRLYKWVQRQILARKVRGLLQEPQNVELLKSLLKKVRGTPTPAGEKIAREPFREYYSRIL